MLKELEENVQVIFHYAALVSFFLPVNIILESNVCGALRLLEMAKKFKRLECFVDVSTLMNNCHLTKYHINIFLKIYHQDSLKRKYIAKETIGKSY